MRHHNQKVVIALLGDFWERIYQSCLSFWPSSALRKRLHSATMRPFPRLEYDQKSRAISVYSFPAITLLLMLPGKFCLAGFGQAALVEVARVESRHFAPMTWVAAQVRSQHHAQLSAEVAGRLVQVVEPGTEVASGQLVAQIEALRYRLNVKELQSEIEQKEANYRFLQRETKRLASLAAKKNAAKNRWDRSRADRDIAKHQWQAAGSRLALAQDRLAQCKLLAPFTGMVTERLRREGERVEPGDPILRLVNPNQLEIQIRPPLRHLPYLSVGKKVQIRSEGQQAQGTVRLKIPVGDALSHLFEVRLDFDNPGWAAGQAVQVALPSGAARTVLAVPRDALVLRRSGASLFRISAEDKAEQIKIEIGLGSGDWIEVKGALQAGDRIVVLGNERLRAGQAVQVQTTP